ncbi:MAG: Glu-tRNA(Gln) amidotransferase subunit GatD [Holophaga sp.]|jgi:glutamyl-tRNA(Gln) amidotransferase subunit D
MTVPMSERADRFQGYRGLAREALDRFGIGVWSEVELVNDRGSRFKGVILPRNETCDDLHVVIKLFNGYNVGIHAERIARARETGYRKAVYKIPEKAFPVDPAKRNVTLLGTGGTIASRLDYRTGAVIPAFTPGELYGAVPELADIANLDTQKLFGVFSENMGPEQYIALAKAIGAEIAKGVDGIVIGHGTDTMAHTGAILSFMVQDSPVPIVLVGSQRSSDRPSSDAALNLMDGVRTAAECDIAEVMLCMFGPTSDNYDLLHRGTRCRKMHSSYRSTFRTIGATPLAMVFREKNDKGSHFTYLTDDYLKRDKARVPVITPVFEEKVTIQYYYPNFNPDIIDGLSSMGYRGLVIAGTGLGHVNKPIYPAVKRAIQKGMTVVMTVQTIWGYAQMYVYDTGRDLLNLGIIPMDNMLPETAYMKLA